MPEISQSNIQPGNGSGVSSEATPPAGGKKTPALGWWGSILLILSLLGPGLITGNFGNDAGGITTYSLCGAEFGLGMVWMVIPVTLLLIIYQEMSGRMGVVTGKGLSDLIRENFGIKIAFYLMMLKVVAGIANATAEFGGVAASMELLGWDKYVAVPLIGLVVWILPIKFSYRRIEKLFLIAILFFGCYIISGILSPVEWPEVGRQLIKPSFHFDNQRYLMLFIALIGTTIAPWMIFYHQSAVVEKGIKLSDYKYFRLETIFAGISVALVIFFIILTSSPLYDNKIPVHTAGEVARALEPLAGHHAELLFAWGFLIASVGAAIILPLSTAFSVCEIFGWESGVNKRFMEAPQFYGLYSLQLLVGIAIILVPGINLITVMVLSQVLNGLIIPVVLVIVLILINKKKIMGEYVNGPVFNFISITATIAISISAVILLITAIKDM